MSIVRVWYSWNRVETLPDRYEFDDLDLLFDTAAKHRLNVWLSANSSSGRWYWLGISAPGAVVEAPGNQDQGRTGSGPVKT